MEITLLTLLFLAGFTMLIIGAIYNLMIDRNAISVLTKEKSSLEKTLTELKKQTTRTYLAFPDANNQPDLTNQNIDNVKVYYTIYNPSAAKPTKPKYVDFYRGPNGLQVRLDDLTPIDYVMVFVEDGEKTWRNASHELPGFRLELKQQ